MTTRQVQNLLDYLGYPVGVPDGITGGQTMHTVMSFWDIIVDMQYQITSMQIGESPDE